MAGYIMSLSFWWGSCKLNLEFCEWSETEILSWSLFYYLSWDGVLLSCPGRLCSCGSPASAFGVAGFTGLCHQAWLVYRIFISRHITTCIVPKWLMLAKATIIAFWIIKCQINCAHWFFIEILLIIKMYKEDGYRNLINMPNSVISFL